MPYLLNTYTMDLKFLKTCSLMVLVLLAGIVSAQISGSHSECTAEECCCSNDLTPAGVMISHVHNKKEWMISYRYMAMGMAGIHKGNQEVNKGEVLETYQAFPDRMQMNMHMLMAMYGISNKLTTMVMFQYNSNYMEMTMPVAKNMHHHAMSSSGIGDTRLYALYALVKKTSSQLNLSAGLNLPSGSLHAKGEAGSAMFPGRRLPYNMQLGSGTIDLLPGMTYLAVKNKISYSAQASGVIRTAYNDLHYKLGNEFSINAWGAWQWLPFAATSLRLEATKAGKIKGSDSSLNMYEDLSANPANYGGTRAFVYLGSSLQFKQGFLKKNRFGAEYGLPFYQKMKGVQMITTHALFLSWSLTF
ncbi:hypothetical protein CNR22_01110 [Sphingobacteriaceae bacterium]|nr:hypothetical protein CNR22_01110 [Sphingobacteriaceae bacterium]